MKKKTLFLFNKRAENYSNRGDYSFGKSLLIFVLFTALFHPAASALRAETIPDESRIEAQNSYNLAEEPNERELKPGETVERAAQPSEIHVYRIRLEAGTSVEFAFGKRNTSIQLTAINPAVGETTKFGSKTFAGKEMGRLIAGPGDFLVEPLVLVAEETGEYIIAARFFSAATYALNCGPAHATTERDRKYAAAGKLFAEIRQWIDAGNSAGDLRDKAEQRAAIYRSLDDKKSLALSLNDVAVTYISNVEWSKGVSYYREALEIFRSLGAVRNVIDNLWSIGRYSSEIGDYQMAIDCYSESLSISRALKDKNMEGGQLHQLGVIYHLLAEEQKAREYYEQSLAVKRSIIPATANSLSGEGVTLTNIGNLYRGVGGGEIPIDAFPPRTRNDREKALEYYRQALEVALKNRQLFPNASTLESFNLQQIGNTHKELGNYSEALTYLTRSLEQYKEGNRKPGQTNVLVSIGALYVEKGEYQKGFEYYGQALELLRAGSYPVNQIGYLNSIAKDYYRVGETQKALDLYQESLSLSRRREQADHAAGALFEIARIERDSGNFSNARRGIEEAIRTVESLRTRITSQDVRTSYFASVKRYYDFYIDLLMQAHKAQPEKSFDALALQMSEKARSRSLLDLLTLSKIDVKQGVDPLLLEREKAARQKLSEKANQQSRLLLGKHTKEEAEKMQSEVARLTDEYQTVQGEIKNKSPRYAALTQPAPLDAKQIQQLLDSGTVLLEYSLGEKKSYLWAVSPDSVASFDLPRRQEIEAQARKVYDLLTARNQNLKGEADDARRARIKAAEDEYPKAAARLSEMLLAPVAARLGNKRLLIVADGALNYISFAALPLPKTIEAAAWQPVGANHEVVTLPSASVLSLLREEIASRRPAPKMLAVFADPIFNSKDLRVNPANKTNSAQTKPATLDGKPEKRSLSRDFERAISDVGLSAGEAGGLPRLPFSRREADSIFKISPGSLSLKETDFEASKANVFNAELDKYRILHFATHGLLNSQHPELSGIVLSLVDKSGGEIDGFVRLQDIYNLDLSADLVVLSACQTALGKDVKGEGLISLTRGFMYAGAPRVVASLWKVDDAATAELMSVFYRKMLIENLRPAAALRAAQAEMMRQTRWKSPYYWAAFTIQGEWR